MTCCVWAPGAAQLFGGRTGVSVLYLILHPEAFTIWENDLRQTNRYNRRKHLLSLALCDKHLHRKCMNAVSYRAKLNRVCRGNYPAAVKRSVPALSTPCQSLREVCREMRMHCDYSVGDRSGGTMTRGRGAQDLVSTERNSRARASSQSCQAGPSSRVISSSLIVLPHGGGSLRAFHSPRRRFLRVPSDEFVCSTEMTRLQLSDHHRLFACSVAHGGMCAMPRRRVR